LEEPVVRPTLAETLAVVHKLQINPKNFGGWFDSLNGSQIVLQRALSRVTSGSIDFKTLTHTVGKRRDGPEMGTKTYSKCSGDLISERLSSPSNIIRGALPHHTFQAAL